MYFATLCSAVLAATPAFAAPAVVARQDIPASAMAELKANNAFCDLSRVALPVAPTPLPLPPSEYTLRHIAIGRGTQNYTCASSTAADIPIAVGAEASLFNVTCDAARLNAQVLGDVSRLALKYPIPSVPEAQKKLSGHHQFTDKKVPLFQLVTGNANYGYVQATVDTKSPAPKDASTGVNGLGSVPWLKLTAVEGDYKVVYRVHTAGGVAPKTCDGQASAFTVDYSAEYWFYA